MALLPFILLVLAIASLLYGRARSRSGQSGGPLFIAAGAAFLLVGVVLQVLNAGRTEGDREMAASAQRGEARGYVMGRHLADTHPGTRALVLTPPEKYPGPRHPDMLQGLKDGCGDKINFVDVLPLPVPPSIARMLATENADAQQSGLDMLGLDAWIQLSEIEPLVETYAGQVDWVILALDAPHQLPGSQWIQNPDAPAAVLLSYSLTGMSKAIASGRIEAAVSYLPPDAVPDRTDSPPGKQYELFARNYLLVTPQNVNTLKEQYPQLF